MLFSTKIRSTETVNLDSRLQPPSFPGLMPLIPSGKFQEKYFRVTNKIDWRSLSEQMVLNALFKLLSDKNIQIDFIESQDQYLFKLLKTNHSTFKISIATHSSETPEIQDHLSHELYGCVYLLANRNRDKRVSLDRVIRLLCKRNSDIHEDTNPRETFVTSVLIKYKSFDWIKFRPARNLGLFSGEEISIDKSVREKLVTELEIFKTHLDQTKNPMTVELTDFVKNMVITHL